MWGPERTPLALEVTRPGQAAVTYAYYTDALGSVVAITSPSGAVVATYAYDPYGAVTQVGGSDAALAERNPLRYRAYYHDTATGRYYLPARYYDPDTMRFLSPDPAPPSAGDPLTLNRYAYCVGDPVDYFDPDGARHEAGGGAGPDHHRYDAVQRVRVYEDSHAAPAASSDAGVRYAAEQRVPTTVGGRGKMDGDLDCIGQVCLGWTQDDLHSVRSDFSGEGAKTIVRTAYSMPPTSWVLIGAGVLLAYGGWQVATTGTIASLTGVAAVPGVGAVVGGGHMIAIGVGLVGVGLTQMEAETGLNIVPWYER